MILNYTHTYIYRVLNSIQHIDGAAQLWRVKIIPAITNSHQRLIQTINAIKKSTTLIFGFQIAVQGQTYYVVISASISVINCSTLWLGKREQSVQVRCCRTYRLHGCSAMIPFFHDQGRFPYIAIISTNKNMNPQFAVILVPWRAAMIDARW